MCYPSTAFSLKRQVRRPEASSFLTCCSATLRYVDIICILCIFTDVCNIYIYIYIHILTIYIYTIAFNTYVYICIDYRSMYAIYDIYIY